ncbi:hypothetical protein N9D65_00090 [Schleiferiaceae bacterium]|nr:hypothetical protein [Schleiferiaceae bacterium]
MKIISHRGYWLAEEEKNSINAFNRSFSLNFGTETDIRDHQRSLVISHDIADESSLNFNEFLEIYCATNMNLPLALNIKADGLHEELSSSLNSFSISNYFVFDMSIPDTLKYIDLGINFFIRQSEYESELPFYENAAGIWLDSFNSHWYSEDVVKSHINKGKKVSIVSSELHGRNYLSHWQVLKTWDVIKNDNVFLCTDFPELATKFFK